ncbi:MAG: reverse transcriptase family protein [Gemmataceae bacterium]|nr:reverse transcriptase family protein [Gemmataceae bacterium]
MRLLESPKQKLKALQRKILHELLDLVPAHAAVHGFRRGHSIVTYAAPHVGQAMVLRLDLSDFFVSVPARRVRALFRALGYPRQVAHLLTGLCTHATPEAAWPDNAGQNSDPVLSERKRNEDWRTRRRHAGPHLPQGAPTSPALANLCTFRLDARLSGLAEAAGAGYTRYADDLAFSGGPNFARAARRFQHHAARIILEEGFDVNWKKTRKMRPATQQRLAGVVVNVRPNIRRKDYDELKAILHNCRRRGPNLQNRSNNPEFRAHLLGRIAHVASIHAERGRKLQLAFDGINWNH